jgi:mono/diheme cytochrome c family protein
VVALVALTAADVFVRETNWRAKGPLLKEVATGGSKFKKPWIPSDELKAHGKTIYDAQCAVCHGAAGEGNGAAAAALNPKPRNFKDGEGWKNGRKVSEIFVTLKMGLGSMPSFATLPSDDRWALVHYISAFGPPNPDCSNDDLRKAGILDPTKDDGGVGGAEVERRKIPVDFAMERYLKTTR